MKLMAGQWFPDQPAFGNPGLIKAENCIPAADHYRAFPSASSLEVAGLAGQAEGLAVGIPVIGEPVLFCGFNESLWRVPGLTASAINVDRVAGYTMLPGDRWRFVQYGRLLLATNFNDRPQSFDMTNLAGTFVDLANSPRAKFIARIRDFVVLGHIFASPDGEVPYRLRWHGFDPATGLPDPTEWTISLETRSDFQDVSDLGGMMGLVGGEFGIALFRKGIARIDFGGQFLFEPHVVDDSIGCEVAGSVVQYGTDTYFWGDEGIFKTAGGPAVPVGTERINRYIREHLDTSRHDDVWAFPDYRRGVILWCFPRADQTNQILAYRPGLDRFSTIEVDIDSIGPTVSFGLDLDNEAEFPDLDTDPRNLDDPQLWSSGLLGIGGQIESPAPPPVEEYPPEAFSDDFTGANASPWNAAKWTGVEAIGTAAATIQANKGQISLPNGSNWLVRMDAAADALADFDLTLSIQMSTTGPQFHNVIFRASAAWAVPIGGGIHNRDDPLNGYALALDAENNLMQLRSVVNGVRLTFPSVPKVWGTAAWRIAIRCIDAEIRAKAWLSADPEPEAWDIEQAESTHAAGVAKLAFVNGENAAHLATIDNFSMVPIVAAEDYDAEVADVVIFNGPSLPATLEWAEIESGEGQRFMVNRAMVYHERGTAQIVIKTRERVADDLVTLGPFSPQSDGIYRFNAPGRFHRLSVLMSGEWASVRGADANGAPLGMR